MRILVWVAGLYFSVSAAATLFTAYEQLKYQGKLEIILLFAVFIFIPVMWIRHRWLACRNPPSRDPVELVYARLSPVVGKSSDQISAEIEEAGESIGGRGGVAETDIWLEYMADRRLAYRRDATEAVIEAYAEEGLDVSEIEPESLIVYLRGNPPTRGRKRWTTSFLPRFLPAAV